MPLNSPATPRTPPAQGNTRPGWQTAATARKRPAHLESDLQTACVRWFALQYPAHADLLFASPNGGKRNVREAARMKREGVKPGIPDLHLAVVTPRAPGLFIELKVGKNKPTPAQTAYHARLAAQGYAVAVVYDFDTFRATIAAYLSH